MMHIHIRALREQRGLSLKYVSTLAEIPSSSLSEKERELYPFSLAELERLAVVFGVTCVCELVSFELTSPCGCHPTEALAGRESYEA